MMILTACIFFVYVFCFLPNVNASISEGAACDAADAEYAKSVDNLHRVYDDILSVFIPIPQANYYNYTLNASADAATLCPGKQLNLSARAAENVMSQCVRIPEQCEKERPVHFVPDVFRAAVKFCETFQAAEYIQHLQTLLPCYVALSQRRPEYSETAHVVYQLVRHGIEASFENSTGSCGFVCGRKCACRWVQIEMPLHTDSPAAHLREVCGQKEYDLVLQLQERVLNALNCSEFGDYVQEFGWLKVNYQANKTTPVLHP